MKLTQRDKRIVQLCLDVFAEWNYYPKSSLAYNDLKMHLLYKLKENKQ